jgi:hypothetical protein
MTVGFAMDKASIDNRAGTIVLALRQNLQYAADLCALFNNTNIFADNAAFLAYGWNQTEVNFLRGAFTDIGGSSGSSLYRISHGQAALGGASDFFFNAQHLTGVL